MTDEGLNVEIEDPILEAFPVMVDAAEQLCRRAAKSEICYVYHRLWPYRRLGGATSRALGRDAHVVNALRRMARESQLKRVLISGSADYALLSRVLHACRSEGIEPDVTVLDICEAPLCINRWYADRCNATVRTVCCDIGIFTADLLFDAVVTDNFLIRIPPRQREQVLRTWRNALRVGGRIITTEPVCAAYPTGSRRVDEAEIEERVTSLLEQSKPYEHMLPIRLETLAEYVRAYYVAQISYPFRSVEEIRALFGASDLEIEALIATSRKRSAQKTDFWQRNPHRITAKRIK